MAINTNRPASDNPIPNLSDDSEFGFDELRSDSSSSEDENHGIGYVGPPNPRKRKGNRHKVRYGQNYNEIMKWHVGMKLLWQSSEMLLGSMV